MTVVGSSMVAVLVHISMYRYTKLYFEACCFHEQSFNTTFVVSVILEYSMDCERR